MQFPNVAVLLDGASTGNWQKWQCLLKKLLCSSNSTRYVSVSKHGIGNKGGIGNKEEL